MVFGIWHFRPIKYNARQSPHFFMDNTLSALSFGASSFVNVTLAVLLIMTLMYIAASHSSASAEDIGHAIFCYLMKTVALLLVGATFVPVMMNILSGEVMKEEVMYGPLLVFFVGVWIFIHFNRVVQHIDAKAVAIPKAIFMYSFQFLGTLLAIFAGLMLVTSLFSIHTLAEWQWHLPVTLLITGLLVSLSFGIHTEKKHKRHLLPVRRKK